MHDFIPSEKPKSLPNDGGRVVINPVKLTFESTARSFFKLQTLEGRCMAGWVIDELISDEGSNSCVFPVKLN
jgi:hypothetical protein